MLAPQSETIHLLCLNIICRSIKGCGLYEPLTLLGKLVDSTASCG